MSFQIKATPEKLARARALNYQGLSYAEIGKILGVCEATAWIWADPANKAINDEYQKLNRRRYRLRKSGINPNSAYARQLLIWV